MKKKEIKKLTKDQELKNIDKLKKDLFNFRFQKVNGQVKSPAKVSETRKSIARLKTIMGENILFGPTPDSVYTYSMTYYKALTALSDSAPTNWAILNAPDLYLYGALLQAEPFLMNDERVPLWERGVRQVINDLQEQDDRDRHSGSEMRVMNTSGYF